MEGIDSLSNTNGIPLTFRQREKFEDRELRRRENSKRENRRRRKKHAKSKTSMQCNFSKARTNRQSGFVPHQVRGKI